MVSPGVPMTDLLLTIQFAFSSVPQEVTQRVWHGCHLFVIARNDAAVWLHLCRPLLRLLGRKLVANETLSVQDLHTTRALQFAGFYPHALFQSCNYR